MNESDPKLLEALRAMAADGPREAPARVEERLLGELRRRSRARRRNLRVAVGTGAIAAGIAVLLWMRPAPAGPSPTVASFDVPANPPAVTKAPLQTPPAQAQRQAASVRLPHQRRSEVALNFYQLPDTDELPPMESATIVRVQLPMSSLRLMGLPVNEDRAAEPVQADMLLGQDGLARGVRFVQ
jgi:hypothetical protein